MTVFHAGNTTPETGDETMPVQNLEQIRERQGKLQATLAEKGESLDAAKRRELKKKIRRAQRKAQRVETMQARVAKAQAKADASAASAAAPAAEATETPQASEEATAAE
jgi:hypothetical protein